MNSKDILILCSNKNYLEHCKFVFEMFDNKCDWDMDKCLIVDDTVNNNDLLKFTEKGILIKKVEKQKKPYIIKFYLFDKCFKNWDNVLYLDVDIYIFNDIKKYFKNNCLDKNKIYACESISPLYNQFCFKWDINIKNKIINNIKDKYNIDPMKKFFNSGIMYYNTNIIKDNSVDKLFEIYNDLILENNHGGNGTDQPIINLLFKDDFEYIDNNKFTLGINFNIKDGKLNTNEVLIHHFFGYFAPWKTIVEDYYINYLFNNKYIKYIKNFNG